MFISAENISKQYVERYILNNVSIYINPGDKIGLIGVNGTGKSTLLKIIAQKEIPDNGTVNLNPGLRINYLNQNPIFDDKLSIFKEVVAKSNLQEEKYYEAKSILTKLGFIDLEQPVKTLSGGQRKRVAIAIVLLKTSDVLILDEPTNHLDSSMVLWLEKYLSAFKGSILMVTHDRYFLDRITNKIIELDDGKIYNYQANYSKYLELKMQREEIELGTQRKNKSVFQKELEWIKQGPRARGTKSKERIARFEQLENKINDTKTNSNLELNSVSTRLGKKIIEINNVSKNYSGENIIDNFSYILPRDARVGITGNNGCGKSTLLNIITGKVQPDIGEVIIGETVKIGYFSQECEEMNLSQRVIDYIKNVSEFIDTIDGTLSASQMLEKFLFTSETQWNIIEKLSGGERRRLFLLRILMEAPNIIILDEPTNDLDIQTLTILEDYLENFKGAVITVSHDRYFLDKVVNCIFQFESDGKIKQYLGGYSNYFEQISSVVKQDKPNISNPKTLIKTKKLKFTFNEQREYDNIDEEISNIESKLKFIERETSEKSTNYELLQELLENKSNTEKELAQKMERWVYLTELAEKIENEI